MGLVAIISSVLGSSSAGAGSAGAGAGALGLFTSVGAGVGGIFVAATLIYLLAYLDLFDAAEVENPELRRTVVAITIPLGMAFAGVVLFNTLQIL